MKKLMFATALVATVAAFADGEPTALNAISFEGYTAGVALPANGVAEMNEDGQSDKQAAYFLYKDGDADGSTVKTFGGENAAAPNNITRPFYFASGSAGANYLDLSTEGGILWRSINAVSGSGSSCTLGAEREIAAEGIYLDTLVQFTPTEDGGTPELDENNDKLAIWLNVDTSVTPPVTNLMVRASYIDDDGTDTSVTPTNFVLTTSSPVVPGQWYRLTVKAISDVTKCKAKNPEAYSSDFYTGFEIYLNGEQLVSSFSAIGSGYIDLATGGGAYAWLDQTADADFITYLQSGKVFPSLLGGQPLSTLTAVGFKGSGALDDIVWTTQDPFANAPEPPVEGYVVDLNGADVPITLTDAQLAVMAQLGVETNSVAAVNAALDTEIGTTGVKAWEAAVLGLAPTAAGLQEFKIDSVTIGADGKVTIELADGVTLATGQGIDITLKVIGSNDLSTWNTTTPLATVTNSLEIPDITPALGESHKFYKVVVEFAATPTQN